ncbi:hypothetical protein INS90_10640 [Trueperella pecoris]|uniref:YdhG-like domain-containing protein n=1 Tax=Trueperella pecoris TaxID=2733571 RepID=A0A7M1R2H5_9ACTO|nr:hypothetical protein [Trueperella pecoris]QOR47675.1 hypothetical protein INS90_10640 [Trueperella pecoris]
MANARTPLDPCAFIDRFPPALKADARALYRLLVSVTGHDAVMWGPSVVGFGEKGPASGGALGESGSSLCDVGGVGDGPDAAGGGRGLGVGPDAAGGGPDGFEIGFSRRGSTLILVLRRYNDYYSRILERLGSVPYGRNAIALPPFSELDRDVLRELIETAWKDRTRADGESPSVAAAGPPAAASPPAAPALY